ncbi:MAG: TonB-dependent receptor plug domain-containing protein [Schleiferiaceae bacterium]
MKKIFFGLLAALPLVLWGQRDTATVIELGEASVEAKRDNPAAYSTQVLAIPVRTVADQGPSAMLQLSRQAPALQLASVGGHTVKPILRGLGGYRVVTAYQGWRYDNMQGGADHGLDFPLLGVDHVEVMLGPNSLALGTDAMAGVLYFSDLRPRSEGRQQALAVNAGANGMPWSGQYSLHRSGPGIYYLGAYAGFNPEYRDGRGDTVHGTHSQTLSVRALGTWNVGKTQHRLKITGVQRRFGLPEQEHAPGEEPDHEHGDQFIQAGHLAWEAERALGAWTLRAVTGLQTSFRAEFESEDGHAGDTAHADHPEAHIAFALHTASQTTTLSRSLGTGLLTLGAHQQLRVLRNDDHAHEWLYPNAEQFQSALFAHYSVEKGRSTRSAGLRGEVGAFAGYAALLRYAYALSKPLSLQARISHGTRGPQLEERFAFGSHIGAGRFEVGDANLRPEQLWNADLSLSYDQPRFDAQLTAFYQAYRNFIYLNPNDSSGSWRFYYVQGDARVYGAEARAHWHPAKRVHVHAQAAVSVGEDAAGNPLPFMAPGRWGAHAAYDVLPKQRLHAELHYDHYLAQNRLSPTEELFLDGPTPAYGLWSASLTGVLNAHASWSLEVLNATNTAYAHHLSIARAFGVLEAGRQVRASLRFAW